jgi:prepilin-type N-terminal cleavage/methylation domain-containing protein
MRTPPRVSNCLHRFSPAREAAGFTLIELVMALVVSGIVMLVVFQLLASQGRLAHLQSAREEVQHTTRSLLELIASELRGADPRGISVAEANSITFRSPRAWGVVCRHTAERLSVLFPAAAVPALRTGEEFLALSPVAASMAWQFLEVADVTSNSAERSQARTHCEAAGVSVPVGTGATSRARMYAPRAGPVADKPLGISSGTAGLHAGTPLYVYEDIRYQIVQPAGMPDWWIRRNTGPAMSMHPLAGPVPETSGLRFRYFDATGQELTDASVPSRVRRVEVSVVAHSRWRFGAHPLRDSASVSVFLRNLD